MLSQSSSAGSPSGSAQLPRCASSVEGGDAGGSTGGSQAAKQDLGNIQRPPLNVADSLLDKEVEEEEEGQSPEDTPMENVSQDGSPPQDPFSSVPQAVSPKKVSSAVAGLLSLDEAMDQVLAGVLPATHTGPSGIQDVVPTCLVSPPKMASSSYCFIVRVPATTKAYRGGKYVQDGYGGGVEALMLYEGLSEQDLEDLGTLFAQDGEKSRSIHDLILRPHSAGPSPLVTLEAELNSLDVCREMALLLRQFPPKRLAERLGDDAVNRTLQLLDTITQLRHDVQFLNDCGEQEAARVEREAARERATLEGNFRRHAKDQLGEIQAPNQRAVDLEAELNQARRKI
ncbi:unnamed protein product [Phytophthora fragariaefolia]|uniref:Unnamed protein product n=1 Tax=Phytophthora fragariaefolia TaxID=1490495 RepID=A0A9W6TI98_9STRA|nr:unnamed protein product [Phytophthora fragariaefolia]